MTTGARSGQAVGEQEVRITLSKLKFSDGTEVSLSANDTVIIVGPNNSGKSATLRAIWAKLSDPTNSPVLTSLKITKYGDEDRLMNRLRTSSFVANPEQPNPIYTFGNSGLYGHQALEFWKSSEEHVGTLRDMLCKFLTAEARLETSKPASNIDVIREAPTHPVHNLIASAELEEKVSSAFNQAFGEDLLLNRLAGSVLPLHVGKRPAIPNGGDRLSAEYASSLNALPRLADQGDGMRSFSGLLLHLFVGIESIFLIDEPEAFLHPPQARQMGKLLAGGVRKDLQCVIATHSGDVLRGALNAGSNVTVLRIQRIGSVNSVKQLDKTKVEELWSDPLLRYSNILDGLFHEKVIVCEADGDARFYSAISDALVERENKLLRDPDVMFAHCGGKHRIPVVVTALRQVGVPVSVIVDFDILNSEEPLRSIIASAGGEWVDFQSDWKVVWSAVTGKKSQVSAIETSKLIHDLLADAKDEPLSDLVAGKIRTILRRSTPWSTAKQTGKSFIPSGEATQAYVRLLDKLKEVSVFIVEVGEMEGFARSVSNHGPRWVNEVLKKSLKSDPELDNARKFIGEVMRLV